MKEHAEHLEVVMLRLSGVETVLDGLIAIGGEDAPITYYDADDDGHPDSIYIGGSHVTIEDGMMKGLKGAFRK